MRSVFITFALSAIISLDSIQAQIVDTTSYSIGMSLGYRLKNQGAANLDYASVIKAIEDVLENRALLLTLSLIHI